MKQDRSGQRFRHQVRQRQRLGLGLGQRAVRQGDPAHGRAGEPAQHLPQQHPGPADLVRGARLREGLPGPARRRRHDGRDEPADLGRRRGRDRARRLPVLRQHAADAAVEVPRRRPRHRHAADRDRNAVYTDPRQRQLFKNIIYVGALSVLLDIEPDVFEKLFAEQYKGKETAAGLEHPALHLGRDFVTENLRVSAGHPGAPVRQGGRPDLRRRQQRRGARAASMAAPRWRPGIRSRRRRRWPRPSRSTASKFRVDPATGQHHFAIVQAEDELASIGMVVGAGWNGARAFTATSGPGISLMTEFIGLAYFAEIPVTIINVQRGGPSTGMPTRTQQADPDRLRLRLARRHQACAAVPGGPARMLRARGCGAGPGRPAADAGVPDDRPRHRHEPAPVQAVRLGRRARLRPRQGHDRRPSWRRARTSAATRTWTATASPGARCPARIRPRAASSPAAPRATRTPATPNAAPTTSTTWSGCCASSRPPPTWCRSRCCATPRRRRRWA